MSDATIKPEPVRPRRRVALYVLLGLISACLLITAALALSNVVLPAHIAKTGRLTSLDKARLSEAVHLRGQLGDTLWSGWGEADVPVIVYDEEYAYLVGYPNPPSGWQKVPGGQALGGPWELVQGDTFNGQAYYSQRLANPGKTPQSFIVLIGNRFVASLASRDWLEIGLGNDFKQQIPSFLQPVFPYRLAGRLFLAAAGGRDWYVLGITHESFHAFEAIKDPARLYASESLYADHIDQYPLDNPSFQQDWQTELNLLAEAVQAKTDADAMALARQFLAQRQQRRTKANLDANLVMLENLKEWEEGLAKYTELTLWRLGATTPGYAPLPEMAGDSGFKNYAGYQQRWAQEVQQIKRSANAPGDQRFYYSGLAQAALLDRLAPGWRTQIFNKNVFLEDILEQAVK